MFQGRKDREAAGGTKSARKRAAQVLRCSQKKGGSPSFQKELSTGTGFKQWTRSRK